MSMTRVNASRLWNQPLDVRLGRQGFRTISASGSIAVEFMVKLFPRSGRALTFPGRIQQNTTTFNGIIPTMLITGSRSGAGGYRMQAYWKLQYDLDIGGFSALSKVRQARSLSNSKVKGLYNIIQSFDLVPPRRSGAYTAAFTNVRGDHRPSGSAQWTWDMSHNKTVRQSRSGPRIVTTTVANLPVVFSGSLSAEASVAVGAELGWDLGPAVTGNVSVGSSAGASLDISFRRDYGLRLIGNFSPEASV